MKLKRDLNLIRGILLKTENDEKIEFENYSDVTVVEHVYLLQKAGFIETTLTPIHNNNFSPIFEIIRITWEGYEFLESIRDKNILQKALEKFKNIDSYGLKIIQEVCTKLILQAVLPTNS